MGKLFRRQLKTMLRKNYLLKIRHPFVTLAEVLLPTVVMLMLIAVRTRVDTTVHPAQPYIRKGMFVEVGGGDISPGFTQILQLLLANNEYLAFAPDTEETSTMINLLSLKFPLLKLVSKVYKSELELESYIRSDTYGTYDQFKNSSNPKIRGAVVFHGQGPQLFDYSIRLNHTWAFSGFPNVKSIMDTNGPYLNDLELGVNIVPTMQYGFSGFLTLQQVLDSFIIFVAQQTADYIGTGHIEIPVTHQMPTSSLKIPWTQYSPSHIRIVPFPTREYTDDEFQSIVKTVMGVLYILGFLYPVSRLISYYVFEKEQKIREGLSMMGLKDEVFHISWLITYTLQFAISSAIITVCAMSTLFKYSDKSLVFTYFFVFGISAIMLSFLISTFFSRAKTAVAVGTLSFLGAFFPYYTVNDPAVSMIFKIIASLLSPTAFALGSINFADYEHAHVGLRWSNIWRASSGVNFLLCLLLMAFDALLYCALGLYCDKVLPRENGARYPWNYLFRKDSLKAKSMKVSQPPPLEVSICNNLLKDRLNPSGIHTSETSIESISLEMKQQELDGRCIQIRNLHKEYASKKGSCRAVNSLQLTLYENQILALLGHNGAGKSTTISMLVGLLPPTSGDALVFGKNITTEMDDIRKILGVCPQHDILFPELTVREHLELFGILKGVEEDILANTVSQMVDEVGLADKLNTIVRALSGGMKRKLSLAIALIGNSKVIVLDEPTSGMDPYSMRLTWQLIKKFKKGRIILLTTHSMDEADVLGDRIAILANGSLKCCGR
uniref:ABC transporter domain-containing protein n=1 Tax=Kalanchoe fedtschenkoi TaxID=63787 RepID=A0A7N0VB22_KALFE